MKRRGNAWSESELQTLFANHHALGIRGLADSGLLPGRSYASIRCQAQAHGLDASHHRKGGGHICTADESPHWPVPAHDPQEATVNRLFGEWLRAA